MAKRLAKREDGRYVVTLTHRGRRMFFYGKTQAEAKAKRDDARDRIKNGEPVRDATRSLKDWLTEWQQSFLETRNCSKSTKDLDASYCVNWIIPMIGQVRLDQLGVGDINRLLVAMKRAGKAPSTQRNCYTTLRKALDDAVTSGLLANNPAHKVKQPQAKHREARFLTTDETRRLLRGCDDLRYAVAVRFILGTGLRRGEALALRWQDIDLARQEARIKGSLMRQGGKLIVSTTKTSAGRRTVALSPSIVGLLTRHKAAQSAERLKAGSQWQDSGFVFTSTLGGAVDPQNLLRTVHIGAAKAGLNDVTVHTLRHTYATVALLNGAPLKVVSVSLGHASIQITADTYGHVTDEAQQAAVDLVAAALGI